MAPARRRDRVAMEAALAAVIDTVNTTGGIVENEDGNLAPAAAPEWVDLGSAYLLACRAMGVEPTGEAVTNSRSSLDPRSPRRPRRP